MLSKVYVMREFYLGKTDIFTSNINDATTGNARICRHFYMYYFLENALKYSMFDL